MVSSKSKRREGNLLPNVRHKKAKRASEADLVEIVEESDVPVDHEEGEVKKTSTNEKAQRDCAEESEIPKGLRPNIISNLTKHQRAKLVEKFRREKRKARKERQKRRREELENIDDEEEREAKKLIPRTLENTREPDITMRVPASGEGEISGGESEADDEKEIRTEEERDEMASYFRKENPPKVAVTTCEKPTAVSIKTVQFGKDLARIIPNAGFFLRRRSSVKGIIRRGTALDFTDIIIINEDHRKMNGLLLIHLPGGPTAHFRLSSVKTTTELRKNFRKISSEKPEVILNNFGTRIGYRVARMLASIFHYSPDFVGRRAVTFHNQRDYIFFRHHKYEFKEGKRVALREIGPRFTLKLRSLQRGTFDTKEGDYEWIHKRGQMDTSRRRFHI
ncbi:unnamed protein product [Cyprideis torosa]|uniref:Uncharacterized protein n=1 Tax=Cyprideis torosa TaxID=163714 RepID=A0A7R8WFJ5_9CRUS|nr:unnamed protein product [Cyprideis torosa]CAG0897065.1 unnamed protein product [Cyprideis torosa]